jgi:hypothetical protein
LRQSVISRQRSQKNTPTIEQKSPLFVLVGRVTGKMRRTFATQWRSEMHRIFQTFIDGLGEGADERAFNAAMSRAAAALELSSSPISACRIAGATRRA